MGKDCGGGVHRGQVLGMTAGHFQRYRVMHGRESFQLPDTTEPLLVRMIVIENSYQRTRKKNEIV